MEVPKSMSIFNGLRFRELNGYSARKRPIVADAEPHVREIGALPVEHEGDHTPPLAVSFCKMSSNSHIFAVSDESGHVSLFDSRQNLTSSTSHRENSEKAKISEWICHENAVFDLCWIKEDRNVLTASGDQTVKVWDAHEKKCSVVLSGHMGSVKSLCPHPSNSDLIVSGSRDGSFALWDLRCKSSSRRSEFCSVPTAVVNRAHLSLQSKRTRRGKATSMSVTSVLFLKDELSIATAGAADSTVKFWDTRYFRAPVTHAAPCLESSTKKEQESHGIACLSQDSSGLFLTASCLDSRIYLYNVLQLEKGPMQSFSGCRIDSFFVKSLLSPDGAYMLSGSSDGNAYVWKVNRPQDDPLALKGHGEEVTAVDWCPSECRKLVTSSDDFTVRMWNITNSYCTSSETSTTSIRRRVMAIPTTESRRRYASENQVNLTENDISKQPSGEASSQTNSPHPIIMPIISTPESQKRKFLSSLDPEETYNMTPETASESPSSVLNPPSSVKRRTIRDYFQVSP